jgi:hypothetical protein
VSLAYIFFGGLQGSFMVTDRDPPRRQFPAAHRLMHMVHGFQCPCERLNPHRRRRNGASAGSFDASRLFAPKTISLGGGDVFTSTWPPDFWNRRDVFNDAATNGAYRANIAASL